jgi:hypothetical protein
VSITTQAISTAQFRVVSKSDYLSGARVWSAQEYVGNQFCGHWHEIGWALDIPGANDIVGRAQ